MKALLAILSVSLNNNSTTFSEKIRSTALLEASANGIEACKNDRVVGKTKIKRKILRDWSPLKRIGWKRKEEKC